MNHPYPDNYHGGYTRGGPAGMQQQQGMGYSHGGYDNPASMARMGHLRHGYNPMPQQYGEGNAGQMHPMMQQQHTGGGMYSPHAGYIGQMGGGHYGGIAPAANYPGYNSMPSGMNHGHPSMSHNMGPSRGQHPHHGNSMMGGGGGYYSNHPHPHPHQQQQHHQQAATNQIANQQPTPPPNYGHQSPGGNSSVPKSTPVPYAQQPPTQQSQNNASQATHHHHPSPHGVTNMQGNNNPSANHCSSSSSSSSSIPPTTTQTYNMPITTQAAITNSSSNIHAQGQQQQMTSSSQNTTAGMMIPNSHSQTHTHGHSQPRPPIAGSMPAMGSAGGGGSTHSIPQHPMRHPTTQQSPQEVADNILQIASSYPTNQTVQVPLKGQNRHAPYHIPRSPHHFNTSSSSPSTSSSTPSSSIPSADNFTAVTDSTAVASSNHFQQQQHPVVASPPIACSSQQSQPNMSPSTSSSVKSPNPALAPIPNPIPSPGISGIRSPSSSHCLSPCSSQQQQRSPGQIASSSYSGHNQPAPSPSSSQHYSPISGGGTPQHHSAAFVHSPPSYHPSSNSQVSLSQSPADNQSMFGNYSNMNLNAHHLHHQHQPSLYAGNNMASPNHSNIQSGQYNHHQQQQCVGNNGNNPLMSLQKLVMLPETQVVDPKSVVNDACLAASANESNVNTDSKNCEGPAERFAESSGLSVGSSGQFSSLSSGDVVETQTVIPSDVSSSNHDDTITETTANDVVDGEVKDASRSDLNRESIGNSMSPANTATEQDEKDNKNYIQGNEVDVSENMMSNKTMNSENERLDNHQKDDLSLNSKSDSPNMSEFKVEDDFDRNAFQKSSSNSPDLLIQDQSVNKAEDQAGKVLKEEMKMEETFNAIETSASNQLLSNRANSVIDQVEQSDTSVDVAKEAENKGDLNNQSEASCDLKSENLLLPVKKEEDDDAQCDIKISPESISPSVLSEVQVVVNGNHTASIAEEEEQEVTEEEECQKVTRARLRNGLKSVVRSKIGKTAKKASQFLRLTTPCSIAVGADEREVCEQFAFRRNGYCHALRTSRLLYNGRGRQDSTSHGDSDESVENISDTSFHSLGTPQDGSKKKNVARKNDVNQSNSGDQAKSTSKENMVGKRSKDSNGGCSNASTNEKDSDFSGRKDSHESKDLSDEEGEMCYYEGVDSTDFFTNNNSSDDSFSSSPDSKQKKQENTQGTLEKSQGDSSLVGNIDNKDVGVDRKKNHDNKSATLSPPMKRARRFSAQRKNEAAKNKKDLVEDNVPLASHVLSNGMNSVNDVHPGRNGEELLHSTAKVNENVSDRENGKVLKTRLNRRKQVFGKLLVPEEQVKQSDVLVKLEKTVFVESSQNNDIIDLTGPSLKEGCTNDSGNTGKIKKEDGNKVITEKTNVSQEIKATDIKAEDQESEMANRSQNTSKVKGTPTKRKRPPVKKKQKGNDTVIQDKEEEIRDSFKSMKFGRTLDMMKSQRRKEQGAAGPFIRVVGNRTAPKKVAVINQSAQNQTVNASGKQNQKSSSKQSMTSSTAISMVSNIYSDKTALVTLSKTVSHQTSWVCAFCNHQSSFHSLGDLFGPYYKEEDISKVEQLAIEEAKRSKEGDKNSDKKKPCPSSSTAKSDKKGQTLSKAGKKGQAVSKGDKKGPSALQSTSKKIKSLGKLKEECPQEVWVHQACALWAPGVYVIGNKLYGMDEAMKDSVDSICSSCKEKGAMVGCLHKGCAMKYHISCAIDQDCCLDEENLSLHCPKHKDKKMRISAASTLTLPSS